MANMRCAITTCKISYHNKPPGVTFHSCPTSSEMRNKWLILLKNKCTLLDWAKSKICSKHFENKYFDSQRRLKENAVPTLFQKQIKVIKEEYAAQSRIERLINKQSQSELTIGVKSAISELQEPDDVNAYVTDDLKCKADAPQEVELWLLAKKQDHLITRLMEQISQHKKHVEVLQKKMNESRSSKKEMESNVESLKYIVKCLQEKHATLEEQIEILTAVESR
ncbi:THAP domain-containing protein 6-like [Ostrinia furnacalis]|uniref:THAP domain-containing protein 6-like n=1 Tax=Ostrinia furnacalis TaxID=93504 RepID=UPI00103D459E|nr:THAP domain-containing protein 6-like [Ostrinia furnacalis]